jgi:uncharacterized protein
MPPAIAQYVLKVHSRCDLACDHCYVYEHADQSWRVKPRQLSRATIDKVAERLAEHAAAHGLPSLQVVLHGGEPLLLGAGGLRRIIEVLRAGIEPETALELRIHTNGVRLSERLCELFAEHQVRVGISLDGDQRANDRHRRFADGRSSYAMVRSGLALLRRPEYREAYAGILCTVNIENDPITVYEALRAEEPPRVDLLLPHANWENPPPGRRDAAAAPYAAWLGQIYRRWTSDGRPFGIRLFDSILSASLGGSSGSEAVGLDPVGFAVIDTDGSWEQADSLKTAYHGAPATGMTVFSHSMDQVAQHPGFAARRGGLGVLSAECRRCPVVRVCGGGLYAHRYRASNGFDNPSVYCADLMALIGQIAASQPRVHRHRLPPDSLGTLAAGPGDIEGITALAAAQLSITRALVAGVAAESGAGDEELRRVAEAGWELLAELDVRHPDATAQVLAHPYIRAWTVRCLRPPRGADRCLDRAHLAGIAAAAAYCAGRPAELMLPVREGWAHLPGVGALQLAAAGTRTVVVRIDQAGQVKAPGQDFAWRPIRRTRWPGPSVALEDTDPFRDCQLWPPASRLDGTELAVWQKAMVAAGDELDRLLPEYSAVLRSALRAVVPLRADAAGNDRSATARHAFGGIAAALPGDLPILLVHEFQHVKLNALLDLYPLIEPSSELLMEVPWRPEPRPAEGVLHGVYAHLAVTALWRARADDDAAGSDAGQALAHFRRHRNGLTSVIDALADTDVLTVAGKAFVTGLRTAIDHLTQ